MRRSERPSPFSALSRAKELEAPAQRILVYRRTEARHGHAHCALQEPGTLTRGFGWTKSTLKPGDKITLIGRRVKSGAPYMNLTERAVVFRTETKELLFRTNNAELPPGLVIKTPAPAGNLGGAVY